MGRVFGVITGRVGWEGCGGVTENALNLLVRWGVYISKRAGAEERGINAEKPSGQCAKRTGPKYMI